MVRIFVDGPDSREMEEVVRAALGPRLEGDWLIFLTKRRATWGVCVLLSPQDRLQEWSFFGPRDSIGAALRKAVEKAGIDMVERRVRKIPHTPERRRTACEA